MRIILLFVLNAGLNLALGLAIAAVLGPEDYGRFAIGMTIAVVLAMGAFDWLRLSATRFYGESKRDGDPELRATLNAGYAVLAAALGGVLLVALGLGLGAGVGASLLSAAVICGVANGLFDYKAALARARFHDRAYAVLVVVKSVGALGLGVGVGVVWHSPAAVLAAAAAAALVAVLAASRDLSDPLARLALARRARFWGFARYGLPIVAANVAFQGVVLLNRSAAAAAFGYAEAGHLSLATDLGLRLFLAVGAAVDVFIFQLAVRRDAEEGAQGAADQLRKNVVVVVGILLLLGVGYVMALPAFEAVFVPSRYRGAFGTLSLILVPGLVLFCIGQFAINPLFQMAGRTGPVVMAASATAVLDAIGIWLVPVQAGVIGIAAVHSLSLVVGAFVILGLALRQTAVLRPDGDLLRVVLAAALTAAALWPMRGMSPAWLALLLDGMVGPAVYGGALLALDVAGLRARVGAWARRQSGASSSIASTRSG